MLHTILQRPHCPRDPPSWACLWLVGKTSHLHHGWSVSPQAEDLRSKDGRKWPQQLHRPQQGTWEIPEYKEAGRRGAQEQVGAGSLDHSAT